MPEGSQLLMPLMLILDQFGMYHSELSDVPKPVSCPWDFFAVSYSNTALGYCFKLSLLSRNQLSFILFSFC